MKRRLARYSLFLAIVFVGFGAWQFSDIFFGGQVPESFWAARRESASIADKIEGMSEDSSKRISAIRALQKDGRHIEALDAIREELNKVSEMREQGTELLNTLTAMTESLSVVSSNEAKEMALRGISDETVIVNRLISYNNDLEEMLQLMSTSFIYGENVSARLDAAVMRANDGAKAISELNKQFNAAMEELSKLSK